MSKLNMKKKKPSSTVTSPVDEKIEQKEILVEKSPCPSIVLPFLNEPIDNKAPGSQTKTLQKNSDMTKRMQIRENLQRNRSFKTINIQNSDFNTEHKNKMERSLSFHHSNSVLNSTDAIGSSHSVSNGCVNKDSKFSSTSLHDIIEILKYNPNKLRTISNDAINKIVSSTKRQKKAENSSLKNIDEYIRDYDISVNNRINSDYKGYMGKDGTCSQTTLDNTTSSSCGMEKPFRSLYKSTSDGKLNCL
jgi:hypothetical protein